jgi:hypothetical protein
MGINLERVTIEDCLDNYKYKNKVVLINDGKIVEIKTEYEKAPLTMPTKAD